MKQVKPGQIPRGGSRTVKAVREKAASRCGTSDRIKCRTRAGNATFAERYLRPLFNGSSDSIYLHDMAGHFLEVNEAFCERLGYSREGLAQMSPADIEPPENAPFVQKRTEDLWRNGHASFETVHVHRLGMLIPVEVNSVSIDYKGRPSVLSIARDVTNRKIFEQMVDHLRRQNELILNSVSEGVLGLDLRGRLTFINPSAAGMLGYRIEELLGKHSHSIWLHTREDGNEYPEEDCPIHMALRHAGEYSVRDDIFWRKDGTSFPVTYTSSTIVEDASIAGAVVTFRDITARKEAEEKIRTALRDKDVLLREIHHRVKNNLQILIGLISFQIKEDNEDGVNQLLMECKDRVNTIAIIHEKLYHAEDFLSIDVRRLISDIAGSLVYSLRDAGKQTDLILNIEEASVGIDVAIPLGLLVNEIVSNSVKHAFPHSMEGEVVIDFHALGDKFELSVHDTGIGFPEDFDIQKSDSFGMYLIYTLAEQLNGIPDFIRDNGTTVRIVFKRDKKE